VAGVALVQARDRLVQHGAVGRRGLVHAHRVAGLVFVALLHPARAQRRARAVGRGRAQARAVQAHLLLERHLDLPRRQQRDAARLVGDGAAGRLHHAQEVHRGLALTALDVPLHDAHAQRGQLRVGGRAPLQLRRQQAGGGEGAVGQRLGLQPLQRLVPVPARQQERDAAGPESRRAVQPRHPAVGLVVVGSPGQRTATRAQGQAAERRQVGRAVGLRAHLRGRQPRTERLRRGVHDLVQPRQQQQAGAIEPGLVPALDLPQQLRRGAAPLVSLQVGGQARQRGGVEALLQGGAPALGRRGIAAVDALGVGAPEGRRPGEGLVGPQLGIQRLERAPVLVVRGQEGGAQQEAALRR
jgi:hypothetical protein